LLCRTTQPIRINDVVSCCRRAEGLLDEATGLHHAH
jgi:hypothetical protein